MSMFRNPVLRGFNPDPSIVRVGADYFLATSTFEWYPGVQIHYSRDLANWALAARPLARASQLDMRGTPDSCGVWAPDLSYADERFHLIYTDVKRYGRTTVTGANGASLRDFHNYWVSCDRIDGEWSDPVYLGSSGFDPALFHDDDGTSWLLAMLWDHRPDRCRFAGITAQRIDLRAGRLVGERQVIFTGTPLGFTEGPHLYKRDGWYHLLVAEGGTGWDHAVVMARSRTVLGPYEPHPDGPVLTSGGQRDVPVARAGHGDLVQTPGGETWMTYLCGRPLPGLGRCVLGRETAIQPMRWGEDGWLRTLANDAAPMPAVPVLDGGEAVPVALAVEHDDFDEADLPAAFQWLRTPAPEQIFSLSARPGHLRLFGRETIGSLFTQALVARRQQAWRYTVTTRIEAEPRNFQQAAGLVCYYNSSKYHYFHVTADAESGRHLRVLSALPDEVRDSAASAPVAIPAGAIDLRVDVDFADARFAWRLAGSVDWIWLPETFDASLLSDEATLSGLPNFTGAFVGVACQDMSDGTLVADFDWFRYEERDAPAHDAGETT